MDGFELLLQASQPSNNFEGGFALSPNKMAFPSTEKIHSKMLDPIDSIMMLAEEAVKQEQQLSNSPPLPSWKDYGPYFNGQNDRRLRAMSEPWTTQDSMNVSLKYGLMGAATTFLSFEGGSTKSISSSNLSAASPHLGGSTPPHNQQQLEQTLPHMLDKYAAIYNKHGRVGIYTKEERIAIVSRFREKRKRRVWRKKIRYFCRKNLADRRVRVKGRFVKAGGKVSAEDMAEEAEGGSSSSGSGSGSGGHNNSGRLMIKLKRGAAGLLSPMEEQQEEEGDEYGEEQEEGEDEYEYGEEHEEGNSDDASGTGGRHVKSDSYTTNSTSSNTPPSNFSAGFSSTAAAATGASGGECKLHFLSSMLGDYIEEELNHSREGTTATAVTAASSGTTAAGKGLAPSPEEFGPGGKKMRRHSIAY